MSLCIDLALKGLGQVSPNPLVGAVIVKNGKVLAKGYHHRLGGPHAEIDALQKIKFKAKGATLYCNLEPCFHQGKTPPCVHEVIKSGIKRVVVAHGDPNSLVAGKSLQFLKKAGVQVDVGVLAKEALMLNRAFVTWMSKGRPYVILKMAVSADGKIAPVQQKRGKISWITGPKARQSVHELRSQVDGVLVGAGTILKDNPRLNVRGVKGSRQPVRIILGLKSRLKSSAQVFTSKGGPIWRVGGPLPKMLQGLAARQISSILVEGGGKVYSSFVRENLWDELIIYVSPKKLGEKAIPLSPAWAEVVSEPGIMNHYTAHHGRDLELGFVRI